MWTVCTPSVITEPTGSPLDNLKEINTLNPGVSLGQSLPRASILPPTPGSTKDGGKRPFTIRITLEAVAPPFSAKMGVGWNCRFLNRIVASPPPTPIFRQDGGTPIFHQDGGKPPRRQTPTCYTMLLRVCNVKHSTMTRWNLERKTLKGCSLGGRWLQRRG